MASQKPKIEAREGVDVKFNDNKTYWKPLVTLEIVVVYHSKLQCHEVLAFHPELGVEAPRIYLDSMLIQKRLDYGDVDRKVSDKKENLIRSKKPVDEAAITKEVIDAAILGYILSRISIVQLPTSENEPLEVTLAAQTGDIVVDEESQRLEVIYDAKPELLTPVQVQFQKKVKITSSDILSAMANVQNEALELKRATYFAQLVASSVDGFKDMLALRNKYKSYSPARIRWIKATRRVLSQLYVAKVTALLERIEARKKQDSAKSFVEEDTNGSAKRGQRNRRPKILRRSIDNSSLPGGSPSAGVGGSPTHLPAIKGPIERSPSKGMMTLGASSGEASGSLGISLPTLSLGSENSPDKQALGASPSKRLGVTPTHSRRGKNSSVQRRSFQTGDEQSYRSLQTSSSDLLAKYGGGGLSRESSGLRGLGDSLKTTLPAPSLLESFASKSSIQLQPLSPQAAYHFSDAMTRTTFAHV